MFGRVLNVPGFLYGMVTQGSECATYNHEHKIMKHFRILMWFDSSQVKWYMKFKYKKLVHCIRVASQISERLKA